MRLHKLEVSSFGPFADTVEVELRPIGCRRAVPSARRHRCRQDHDPRRGFPLPCTGGFRVRATRANGYCPITRPPVRCRAWNSKRPSVVAESNLFVVQSIRARRSVATGSITENAKATLTWLDGRGENLSRIPDIGDEINRLMGMSADQFFQVVLLPQGEFAKFLRAESDERGNCSSVCSTPSVCLRPRHGSTPSERQVRPRRGQGAIRAAAAREGRDSCGTRGRRRGTPTGMVAQTPRRGSGHRDTSLAELVTAKDAAAGG